MCLNTLANSLSNIFVNVYLFKLTQNPYEVALFNFISYLVWLPSFFIAGWLGKKIGRKSGIVIGGFFQLLFYLLILWLSDASTEWIWLLGAAFGIGSGFYWLSINVLSVDMTNDSNRDWFNGVSGVFGSVSQMIGPLCSGWLVSLMPNFTGYSMIFATSLVIFLCSMLLSLLLPREEGNHPFGWKKIWKIHRVKEWRQLSFAFIALSFRDGVLSFVIWIWVYMVTKSEVILGNFAFLATLLSIISFYLIGRYGKREHRMGYFMWGSVALSLSLFGLAFEVSWFTLILFGVLAGICRPLFEVPFHTIALNSIEKFDERNKYRVELVIAREAALSIGRIISVGLLVYLYKQAEPENFLPWFIVLLIIAGMVPFYFLRGHKKFFLLDYKDAKTTDY
jgi:MFS transporter, YQGE family, putative transporter